MKYLKTFEANSINWQFYWQYKELKINDYIMINPYNLTNYIEPCIIKELPNMINSSYYGEKITGNKEAFFREHIIRKMTPKEIEQFELEKNANKYNL